MTQKQIEALLNSRTFPDGCKKPTLVETHISWVILTDAFAFKIKKPVKFSFLDFSTLALRKHFCEEELRLNQRLTHIYEAVVPIVKSGAGWSIGTAGRPVDYAVKMQRLPPDRQMHTLMENGLVTGAEIKALGQMIARFHQQATIIRKPFDADTAQADFADLASVADVLTTNVDSQYAQLIEDWIAVSQSAIGQLENRFQQRIQAGFIRDGHGDLHSGNIFLLDEPVIFDCIEFNEHLRINDVLSELAFLCMDLESYGRSDFRAVLMEAYQAVFPSLTEPADEIIFLYYLLYRASVRLKVAAFKLKENIAEKERVPASLRKEISAHSSLCAQYAAQLKTSLVH